MHHVTDTITDYFANLKNAASWALHYALEGTGTVLVATGSILTSTGCTLKVCGEKIKPARKPRTHTKSCRRVRAVSQPA